ncbi:GNAT family N-acetyltransferase [Thalassobacillus pellis]|uniref:GNAT family N-acetyltransferase n=1 Tax=Thalassobacillus pellis TaxID=748008 RepID=UPI00195FED3E|nr:GNAT family N-acetyltransferase [Thalassobacillus pellis]MBM7552983.1 ribosomal protein S18 acetylase RimI-like enzyme [Thalassobacillus pellis]
MELKEIHTPSEEVWKLLLLADPSREMVKKYLSMGKLYGFYLNNTLVGVLVWKAIKDHEAEIVNIAIREEEQGKGYGRVLLNHSFTLLKQCGCRLVWIGTGNSSISQLYLYQSCGFEMKYIKKDFFTDHYPELLYENGIPCRDMIMLRKEL